MPWERFQQQKNTHNRSASPIIENPFGVICDSPHRGHDVITESVCRILLNRLINSINGRSRGKVLHTIFVLYSSVDPYDSLHKGPVINTESISMPWRHFVVRNIALYMKYMVFAQKVFTKFISQMEPPIITKDQLYTQHGKVITPITKCGLKLLVHSQTSTVPPLKFGNG